MEVGTLDIKEPKFTDAEVWIADILSTSEENCNERTLATYFLRFLDAKCWNQESQQQITAAYRRYQRLKRRNDAMAEIKVALDLHELMHADASHPN